MAFTRWIPTTLDSDPYKSLIEGFIGREFPQISNCRTEDIMEAVMFEFLGTKQTRVGPIPNLESMVKMRDVIRRAIEAQRSIPVLIASASVKVPIGHELDVAELTAMRMLACLQGRVQKHYPAGMDFRLRMEDLTELILSGDSPELREHITNYKNAFVQMVRVLGYDKFITLVPESSLDTKNEFTALADSFVPHFQEYLRRTQDNHPSLDVWLRQQTGWVNGASAETRAWFYARYAKMYPDLPTGAYPVMLAEYFSAILARHKLGIIGEDKTFDGRLEIAFNNPPPNAPKISPRVHYRTVPLSHSSNSQPYWNVKGYIRIGNDNSVRFALGKWDDPGYHTGRLLLSNGQEEVSISADYVLE